MLARALFRLTTGRLARNSFSALASGCDTRRSYNHGLAAGFLFVVGGDSSGGERTGFLESTSR